MSTIDIQTTQNVTIAYELASLSNRIAAGLIDLGIVILINIGIFYLTYLVIGDLLGEDGSLSMVMQFIPIVTYMGYHLISEITANGQSWGKKAMGLKVIRLDGEEAGLSDYLLRSIFHIIDTIFSLGILAILGVSSSQRKQRLGDMTANTTVIKLNSSNVLNLKDVLKISTLQDYEPIYLNIKHFNESDILLIKSALKRYKQYPNQAHQEAIVLMANRFSDLLELPEKPKNKINFLETLLKDYVVLTR